jgi:murein DD-endopeptidase MepM/ murein hydrolase activator NlpD
MKKKAEERRAEQEGEKPAAPPKDKKDKPPRHTDAQRPPEKKQEPADNHKGRGVYHTVKRGETLYRICKTYGVSVEEVMRANGITDPTSIKVGQKIWIPGAEKARAVPPAPPSSTDGDSEQPGGSGDDTLPADLKGAFFFPVPGGKISSRFGPRGDSMHDGVDILAPEGTPIYAADDGKVVYADDTIRGYGNMIIIKHAGDISTVYAHNSKNLVHTGDMVKRGQKIAEVGQTGRATAPHCHFEVRVGEKPVDPEFFLPAS